jgi:hypothetical protein
MSGTNFGIVEYFLHFLKQLFFINFTYNAFYSQAQGLKAISLKVSVLIF